MQIELLESLLKNTAPDALPDALDKLLCQYNLKIDTIQALKDYSAQFYFTQPAEAVRLAEIAHQLSLRMAAPAPALGNWTLANALLHASRYRDAATLFAQARTEYLAAGQALDAARMGVGHIGVLAYVGQSREGLALAKQIEPLLAENERLRTEIARLQGSGA